MTKNFTLILLFLLISNRQTFAQKDLFNAGAILGLNIASLPNDENSYNGLNAGIFCNADINEHYDLKMEMLFSQNGEYILPKYYPNIDYGKIRLNHVELPFHFDFYVNSYKKTSFLPDWALEIGFAYAKLFSYYAEDNLGYDITDQVIYDYMDTFLFQFGTTVYFSEHFAYNIRFSKPIKNSILEMSGALRLIYRL
jgi:hypothetical protein